MMSYQCTLPASMRSPLSQHLWLETGGLLNVPDDESNIVNFTDVYFKLVNQLEPFMLLEDKRECGNGHQWLSVCVDMSTFGYGIIDHTFKN